jgi:uroporphyrin-III C-methyltransferase
MPKLGRVSIIGAGPGPADLLTVRAVRLLRAAEVVLHDDLVSSDVLSLCSPTANVVSVGKRCGRRGFSQGQINQLMIHYARQGREVARLKSGDPSVFGRLGEELDALREAGIEFDVTPGVTAVTAAAAAAGLTLTDRRAASSLLVVTGHSAAGASPHPPVDLLRTTVAVYMPGPDYGQTARELMKAGIDSSTPCVAVSNAGRPGQQVQELALGELEHACHIPAPAVLIVGSVAGVAAGEKASPSVAQECLCAVAASECPSHPQL